MLLLQTCFGSTYQSVNTREGTELPLKVLTDPLHAFAPSKPLLGCAGAILMTMTV